MQSISFVWTSRRHLIVFSIGNLVKMEKMEEGLKSCRNLRHNWTDCIQTGKYWDTNVNSSCICRVWSDWGPRQSMQAFFIIFAELCHSLLCLNTSWYWCGLQRWYVLEVHQVGSVVPQRRRHSGSHGGNCVGCWGIVGEWNDVRLVLPSSFPQRFWSRKTRTFWWNLTFLEHVERKGLNCLLQEEADIGGGTYSKHTTRVQGRWYRRRKAFVPKNCNNPKFYTFTTNWLDAGKLSVCILCLSV